MKETQTKKLSLKEIFNKMKNFKTTKKQSKKNTKKPAQFINSKDCVNNEYTNVQKVPINIFVGTSRIPLYKVMPDANACAYMGLFDKAPEDWSVAYKEYKLLQSIMSVKYSSCPRFACGRFYKLIEKDAIGCFEVVNEKPEDWENTYNNYFENATWQDIPMQSPVWIENTYYTKSGVKYDLQTEKPVDWETNCENYYEK